MTKREMAVHQEMLAENKAMRKCLKKTLTDLERFSKLHARIDNTISHYYLIKNVRFNNIRARIQRVLKDGE